MATQRQVLAAARRRWGKHVYLRHDSRAPTPQRREALRAQLQNLRDEEELHRVTWKEAETSWRKLIAAVQFYLDTEATNSRAELRQAASEAAALAERIDAGRNLAEEIRRIEHLPLLERYRICDASSGMFSVLVTAGDTLDELLQKVQRSG